MKKLSFAIAFALLLAGNSFAYDSALDSLAQVTGKGKRGGIENKARSVCTSKEVSGEDSLSEICKRHKEFRENRSKESGINENGKSKRR